MLLTVVIAFAARILNMMCLLVLCMILSPTLFMSQIANIFLIADSKIIGLRFTHGPFFLPGFWSDLRIPRLSSTGVSPSPAVSEWC